MKTHMVRRNCRALGIWQMVMFTLAIISAGANAQADDADRIQPYAANPFSWQYKGQPVLLLGGSGNDNPFNHLTGLMAGGDELGGAAPGFPAPMSQTLEEHLDTLVALAGNYLRNTTSSRMRSTSSGWSRAMICCPIVRKTKPTFSRRFGTKTRSKRNEEVT